LSEPVAIQEIFYLLIWQKILLFVNIPPFRESKKSISVELQQEKICLNLKSIKCW